MNSEEKLNTLKERLIADKLDPYLASQTGVVLLECFEQYNGFLKAERVYEAKLCLPNQFKAWRQTLISWGYVIHPEHPIEPWKHYPGVKLKDLVPDFETAPTEMSQQEQIKDLYKCISILSKKIYALEQAGKTYKQPTTSKTSNWGRTGIP